MNDREEFLDECIAIVIRAHAGARRQELLGSRDYFEVPSGALPVNGGAELQIEPRHPRALQLRYDGSRLDTIFPADFKAGGSLAKLIASRVINEAKHHNKIDRQSDQLPPDFGREFR